MIPRAIDRSVYEPHVEALYEAAHAGPDEVWRPSKLALELFGHPGVVFRENIPELGWLARRGDRRVVVVQAGLSRPILEWVVGHELGHWIRGTEHGDPQEELICDYIGAAIQMRRSVFLRRARVSRRSLPQLAFEFGTTQTSVALRLGETDRWAVAVVLPQRIYARGALEHVDHALLREWSLSGRPGLRRTMLTDTLEPRVLLAHKQR